MNWYKKAQEVIDQREQTDNIVPYTEVGHDIFNSRWDSSVNIPDKPNYMWLLNNGSIDIEPETEATAGHAYVDRWSGTEWAKRYSGRYSSKTKTLSLTPPREGVSQFRAIPGAIKHMLKRKFPEMQKLIVF